MRHMLLLLLLVFPVLNSCRRVRDSLRQTANDYQANDALALTQGLSADIHSADVHNCAALLWNRGYVQGVAEGLNGRFGALRFCMPKDYRHGEVYDVVLKYLNHHPERLHDYRVFVIGDALIDAYPCHSR